MNGEKIKKARKAAGLSQEALGEVLGRHKTTISKWEKSGDVPHDMAEDLAEALGVAVEDLRLESGSMLRGKRYVDSRESWVEWMAKMVGDEEGNVRLILIAIARLAQRDPRWTAAFTLETLIDDTSIDPDVLRSSWDEVMASPWIERSGSLEYVVYLKIP